MLFENENPYLEMILNLGEQEYLNKDNNIENDTEGFLKGNMFEDEYLPYKNMTYIKPELNTQREKELFNIMKYSFVINDYNLYLDLHPDDMIIFNKFKKATNTLKELKDSYIRKYGPLDICESDYQSFKWLSSPWPWDKEDGKYV